MEDYFPPKRLAVLRVIEAGKSQPQVLAEPKKKAAKATKKVRHCVVGPSVHHWELGESMF